MSFTKMALIPLAMLLMPALGAEGDKTLPLLKAKQALDNIRFISKDGKYTYYQKRSGDLQLATNYSNHTVLEGEKFSEYLIASSPARKKLLVSRDSSFHSQMSHHKLRDFFLMDFGARKAEQIGSGQNPKLHQNDSFISYYLPKQKTIEVKKLNAGSKKPIAIRLLNPLNEYFMPEVFMPTPNDIIYSDINEGGHQAFLMVSTLEKKPNTVFKSAYPGSKLEACLDGDNLYVGEFERGVAKGGSKILKIALYNNPGFQKSEILYQSQQSDLGNMICSGSKIYFIKTLSHDKELNLKETEVASLDLKSQKVEILSSLKRVSQLLEMDETILCPFEGEYHIVKGSLNLTNDEIKRGKEQ